VFLAIYVRGSISLVSRKNYARSSAKYYDEFLGNNVKEIGAKKERGRKKKTKRQRIVKDVRRRDCWTYFGC
jgi:hypothetical protein